MCNAYIMIILLKVESSCNMVEDGSILNEFHITFEIKTILTIKTDKM